jgi:hypothetical protein
MQRCRDPAEGSDRLPLVKCAWPGNPSSSSSASSSPRALSNSLSPCPVCISPLGLKPFEVGQVAEGGEAERFQEFRLWCKDRKQGIFDDPTTLR